MKKNWKHIIKAGPCPSIDKLVLYYKGKLSKKESFTIENHLAGCEICRDLLEGLGEIKDTDKLAKTEAELKQMIKNLLAPQQEKRRIIPLYQRLAIAASILLLTGISIIFYKISENPVKPISQTAIQKTSPELENKDANKRSAPMAVISSTSKEKKEIDKTVQRNKATINVSGSKIQNESLPESGKNVEKENTQVYFDVSKSKSELQNVETKNEMPAYPPESTEKLSQKAMRIEYNKDKKLTSKIITGKVTDENGQELPGVNVIIEGTTQGTLTDVNGKFKITAEKPDAVLKVSYIGYKTEEFTVPYSDTLLIAMKEDVKKLEEVVVIGYGTIKKSDLTGAVSSVRSDDIAVADKKRNENLIQIDSLKNILKNDVQNKKIIQQLAEKYLEIPYQQEALNELNILRSQITETAQKNELEKIIQLTKDGKYSKALKKLKRLK